MGKKVATTSQLHSTGFMQKCWMILVVVALSSCGSNVFYERYDELDGGWLYQNTFKHKVDVEDTAQWYNLLINVRHTNDYPYANLWVDLTTTTPDSVVKSQKFDLKLAKPSGQWLGKSWGSTITQERLVRRVRFAQKGTYQFKLQHDMRVNLVPAVTHVGMSLIPYEGKPEESQ